jgi:nucleoside-diphosphate-sugar epimerase
MHIAIAGCGWLGTALGVHLKNQGHQVTAIRRNPERLGELAALGLKPLALDLSDPQAHLALAADIEAIVACQSARSDSAEGYRAAYLTVNQNLLRAAERLPLRALVYTGSTGVFGYRDGREVTESTAVSPASPTSEVLVEAEQQLVHASNQGIPTRIVRLSGLYGPGRWGTLQRVRSGALALGPGDDAYMNFCHLDDAVAMVEAALLRGGDGAIYHASDAQPPMRRDVVRWMAARLGIDPQTRAEASPYAAPSRRISASWSRDQLGVTLRFADFKAGFDQAAHPT